MSLSMFGHQTELNNVHDWLITNRLALTIKKSNFSIFRPRQKKKMHFSPQISILDCETNERVSLEQKSYIKYLGVLIDQNLSWRNDLNYVIIKNNREILRSPYCPYKYLQFFNFSLYNLWTHCLGQCIQCLFKQKQVLRLIYFTDRREHAIPLFAKAKILPVMFLHYEAVSKLMFEVHSQSAPINIVKLFTKASHIHTDNTRSSKSQLFSAKYSRLKLTKKKTFSRVGAKIWNKIPNEFKTLSRNSFTKQMKTSLFQILDNEDSYLDVKNISSKFKDCTIKTN